MNTTIFINRELRALSSSSSMLNWHHSYYYNYYNNLLAAEEAYLPSHGNGVSSRVRRREGGGMFTLIYN